MDEEVYSIFSQVGGEEWREWEGGQNNLFVVHNRKNDYAGS